MKRMLSIFLVSIACKQGTCENSKYSDLQVQATFVDSQTGKPLNRAIVTIGEDWIFPSESRKQPSFQTDSKGRVTLPTRALKVGAAIQNETGIGVTSRDEFSADVKNRIRVAIHPWARLEGLLEDSGGNPLGGVPIEMTRVGRNVSQGPGSSLRPATIHHAALTKTAADGSFSFEHLLPVAIDSGESIPYRLFETVYFAGDVPDEESQVFLSVVRRELKLLPGKTATLELVGLPRSSTIVKGRILMADGGAASQDAVQSAFGKWSLLSLSPSSGKFSPKFGPGYSSGGVGIQLDETGQFEARVPVAGRWELGGFLTGGPQFSGKVASVPIEVSGRQEIADLGDLYLFKAPVREEIRLQRERDATITVSVQVLGPGGNPVPEAKVSVERLIGILENQLLSVEPDTPLMEKTGQDGWCEIRVPIQRKGQDKNLWNLARVSVLVQQSGFGSVGFPVDLNHPAARISIRKSAE